MATSITADAQFAPDSPLEEAGFELLVPFDMDAAHAGQMPGNSSGKSAANLESRLRRPLTNSKVPLPSALVFERVSGRDRCSTAAGLTQRGSPTVAPAHSCARFKGVAPQARVPPNGRR
jgi:hypothetical protein